MKHIIVVIGVMLTVLTCLTSCEGKKHEQQESETSIQQPKSNNPNGNNNDVKKTFSTNKGTFDLDKALNHAYTLGYQNGVTDKNNSMPSRARQRDIDDYKGLWVMLYGIPTSTEEAEKAYKACREKYLKGLDEAFYATD